MTPHQLIEEPLGLGAIIVVGKAQLGAHVLDRRVDFPAVRERGDVVGGRLSPAHEGADHVKRLACHRIFGGHHVGLQLPLACRGVRQRVQVQVSGQPAQLQGGRVRWVVGDFALDRCYQLLVRLVQFGAAGFRVS